jgi:hypothetical protein
MPGSATTQADRRRCGESAEPHLAPLTGEWALWRDLAIRSAGLPVSGLGPSMSAGGSPATGWLSFRRIIDIPLETCVAALENGQRTGPRSDLHIGRSLLRGPIEHDRDSGHTASRSAWPAGRCARCCP